MDEIAYYKSFFEKARIDLNNFFHFKAKNLPIEEHDLEVSKILNSLCKSDERLSHFSFYSEEEPNSEIKAPMIMLDPIDGTREYRKGTDECCVSMSFLNSFENENENIHWIWNFRNNNSLFSYKGKIEKINKTLSNFGTNTGLVSRREFEEKILDGYLNEFNFEPVGSIANKLMLLALGSADYVYSASNKNIWDILAGTLILKHLGYDLWDKQGKVETYNKQIFQGPLLWCKESIRPSLEQLLD